MGLKPDFIENQKREAERRLAARKAQLESKGIDERALRRDPMIRRARAEIRQASRRLARIGALDKQNADLAAAKAAPKPEKGAAKKGGDKSKGGGDKPKGEKKGGEPKAAKGGEPKPDAEA